MGAIIFSVTATLLVLSFNRVIQLGLIKKILADVRRKHTVYRADMLWALPALLVFLPLHVVLHFAFNVLTMGWNFVIKMIGLTGSLALMLIKLAVNKVLKTLNKILRDLVQLSTDLNDLANEMSETGHTVSAALDRFAVGVLHLLAIRPFFAIVMYRDPQGHLANRFLSIGPLADRFLAA